MFYCSNTKFECKRVGIIWRIWRSGEMSEQRAVFYESIKVLETTKYLTYYMKYQLAPVIMSVKPAITLNIGNKKEMPVHKVTILKVIENLGLNGMILRDTPNGHIVLAYRVCRLEELLQDEQIAETLMELGYPIHSVYMALSYLRKRYDYCKCPPELGLFLGFPIEDVTDYMCGTKKKCLLCGYWQVYNNVEKAKRIFKQYDDAKQNMLGELLLEIEELKAIS